MLDPHDRAPPCPAKGVVMETTVDRPDRDTSRRVGALASTAGARIPGRSAPAARPTTPSTGVDTAGAHRPGLRISRSGWITAAIGALAAVLYTWSLSSVGYANSYYTAAVKSATVSWKAFFFGSIDPGNFITVDKPPAALWVQALSGRIFGFSSWSMLAARGPGRGGLGADPAPPGQAVGRQHRRPPLGPGLRPDPGGGGHVPLQQPRRPAHPALPGRGLGLVEGGRDRPHPPPAGVGGAHRAGLRHQDAPGLPGAARLHRRLPAGRAAQAGQAHLAARPGRRDPAGGRRLVDRHRGPDAGRVDGPTSAAPRTTRSSACSPATTACPACSATPAAAAAGGRRAGPGRRQHRLRRHLRGAAPVQLGAGRPGGVAHPAWPWPAWPPGCGCHAAAPAPTAPGPAGCCGAVGP